MGIADIIKLIRSGSLAGAVNPLGMAYNGVKLAYPFTQDKNFPGVAEKRHANAEIVKNAYRQHFADTPMTSPLDSLPSTGDMLTKGGSGLAAFMSDPYGVNKPSAPMQPTQPMPPVQGLDTGSPPPAPTPAPAPAPTPAPLGTGALGGPSDPVGLDKPPAPAPFVGTGGLGGPSDPVGLNMPFAPHVPTTPMPQARPAAAPPPQPQPSQQSWFAHNAAMMRDPATGNFIDPQAAARADATGPEVIQKFMNYFHNKGVS